MASQILIQPHLWQTIAKYARSAKRSYVAVAYMGIGGGRLLPLKKGDTLVVDMSLASVKAGRSSPHEIAKFRKKGVRVFTCANLHAKVFVLGNRAIVGSSNVSKNSAANLLEAAVITTDPEVVRDCRGFVKSLAIERVTPKYLEKCIRLYKPPSGTQAGSAGPASHDAELWIQSTKGVDYDQADDDAVRSSLVQAKKRASHAAGYSLKSTRFNDRSSFARRAKFPDWLITLHDDGKTVRAYEPARVLHTRPYKSPTGSRRVMLTVETPVSPKSMPWPEFKKILKAAGVTRVHPLMGRRIGNPGVKLALLAVWQSG